MQDRVLDGVRESTRTEIIVHVLLESVDIQILLLLAVLVLQLFGFAQLGRRRHLLQVVVHQFFKQQLLLVVFHRCNILGLGIRSFDDLPVFRRQLAEHALVGFHDRLLRLHLVLAQ